MVSNLLNNFYLPFIQKDWANEVLEGIPEKATINHNDNGNATSKSKNSKNKRHTNRNTRFSIIPTDIPHRANIVDKTKIKRTTTSSKDVSII